MTETLLIDCSRTKPAPTAVAAPGYRGVLGYISHDPAKDLTGPQARAYLDAGLVVGLVFETTADRALGGKAAGATDRTFAEQQAHKRGYPTGCPIFYAVDGDFDPKTVLSYFDGIAGGQEYPAGVYGSIRVVEAVLKAKRAKVGWQTEAWSGAKVSPLASLYQRTGKTAPPIHGVRGSAYDEDVVLKPVRLWGGVVAPPQVKPTAVGWSTPVGVALRLITRRAGRRTVPLTAHARMVAVAAIKALTHAVNVK